jgi:hypothetical protein
MILKLRQLQIQLDIEFFFKSKLRLQLEQNYSSIVIAIRVFFKFFHVSKLERHSQHKLKHYLEFLSIFILSIEKIHKIF